MADNDLKIWQNYLLPNPFHIVDAKFDWVLRPISHGNPAMPFVDLIKTNNFANLRFFQISHIIVKKLNFRFSIVFS